MSYEQGVAALPYGSANIRDRNQKKTVLLQSLTAEAEPTARCKRSYTVRLNVDAAG